MMRFIDDKIRLNSLEYILLGSLSAAFMYFIFSAQIINNVVIFNILFSVRLILAFLTFIISIFITSLYTKLLKFNSIEMHNTWELNNMDAELLFDQTAKEKIKDITRIRIIKILYLILISLNGTIYSFSIIPFFLPFDRDLIILYYTVLLLIVIPIINIKILIISSEIFSNIRIYLQNNNLIIRNNFLKLTFTSKITKFGEIKYEEKQNNSGSYHIKYRKRILVSTIEFSKISTLKAKIEELNLKNQNHILT